MIDESKKTMVLQEISSLIGTKSIPAILKSLNWIELDSGIWLLTDKQYSFFKKNIPEDFNKKVKYAGLYIGKIRRNFGLSMESLYPLRNYISRYVTIKGKTLQKYLYGKTVNVKITEAELSNLELQKVIVMSTDKQPLGISSFTILEKSTENNQTYLRLKLDPITDLGMFLRSERTMFE